MGGMFEIGGIIGGVVTLILGITILVWPRVIAYVIGTWLILVGALTMLNSFSWFS